MGKGGRKEEEYEKEEEEKEEKKLPMHITVPPSCSLTSVPCSTEGFRRALATSAERSGSYGFAILTWPTMPASKKVRGRS